jgi:hypothetical protein
MKRAISRAVFPARRAALRAALLAALLIFPGCQNPSDSGPSGSEEEGVSGPALRGTVSVTGVAQVGEPLSADTKLLGGTGALSYQWVRGESGPIDGALSAEYVPDSADAGQTLKVRVSRAGYQGTVESGATEPVLPLGDGDFSYWPFHENIRYFSLSQKKELEAPKRFTTEWDLAIEAQGGFCYIYTNSGASAEHFGTTGQGRVWFTNKTDFDDVALADRVTDYTGVNAPYADCAAYETDVVRYQTGMTAVLPSRMNIMNYYGYHSGDGLTAATAFGWSDPPPPSAPFYDFNKKAFGYVMGGMPPPWYPTKQVYIIRHADGVHFSKFQVYSLSYSSGFNYAIKFKFENVE